METSSHNNHPHKHFSPVSFVAGLLIALAVFFVIYKFISSPETKKKESILKDSAKTEQLSNSIIKKDSIIFFREHFYKRHHHRHIDQDAEPIVVSTHEVDALEKGYLSDRQRRILELLPNAPVIYIFDLKVTDYQNLYFTMNEPFIGEPLLVENKLVAGQVLHDGLKAFAEEKFDDCFIKMALLEKANANDPNALFYWGMSAYYKKDYPVAELHFQKILASKNNVFKQEANWFLAMALYDSNRKEEAKKILQQIIDNKGFYTERAKEKLKQIS